jgi:hypothetical protein
MCKKPFHKVTAYKTPIKKGKNGKAKKCSKEVKIKNKRQSDHFDVADFRGESESEDEQYRPRPTRSRSRRAPSSRSTQGNEGYERGGWLVDSDEEGEWEEDEWMSPVRRTRTRAATRTQFQAQAQPQLRPQFQSATSTLQEYPSQFRQRRGRAQLSALTGPDGPSEGGQIPPGLRIGDVIEIIDLETASPVRTRQRGLPSHQISTSSQYPHATRRFARDEAVVVVADGLSTAGTRRQSERVSIASSDSSVIMLSPLTDRNSRRASLASSHMNTSSRSSRSSGRNSWGEYSYDIDLIAEEDGEEALVPLEAFRSDPVGEARQRQRGGAGESYSSSNQASQEYSSSTGPGGATSSEQYSEWFTARRGEEGGRTTDDGSLLVSSSRYLLCDKDSDVCVSPILTCGHGRVEDGGGIEVLEVKILSLRERLAARKK